MESVDFTKMRRAMVDSQLRTSGVNTPWIVAAMGDVPREDFVATALRNTAYTDRSLPGDPPLNPPLATAMLLQAAEITAADTVLLIGTPGGYTATILARQASDVSTIETMAQLPAVDAFSCIIIDGAVEVLPDSLLRLAHEGARIVTGVVEGSVTRLASGIVRNGRVALRPFIDMEIAPLPGFARTKEFVF